LLFDELIFGIFFKDLKNLTFNKKKYCGDTTKETLSSMLLN